jgi:hypothetical protein
LKKQQLLCKTQQEISPSTTNQLDRCRNATFGGAKLEPTTKRVQLIRFVRWASPRTIKENFVTQEDIDTLLGRNNFEGEVRGYEIQSKTLVCNI